MRWCPRCGRPKEGHAIERIVTHGPLGKKIERVRPCRLREAGEHKGIPVFRADG